MGGCSVWVTARSARRGTSAIKAWLARSFQCIASRLTRELCHHLSKVEPKQLLRRGVVRSIRASCARRGGRLFVQLVRAWRFHGAELLECAQALHEFASVSRRFARVRSARLRMVRIA